MCNDRCRLMWSYCWLIVTVLATVIAKDVNALQDEKSCLTINNAVWSTDDKICACEDHYMALRSVAETDVELAEPEDVEMRCILCPEGGECSGGTDLSSVKAKPGYWRDEKSEMRFYRCHNPQNCPDVGSKCAEGHSGPLCAACKPGLWRSSDGQCRSEKEHNLWKSVGKALITVVLLCLSLFAVVKSPRVYTNCTALDETTITPTEVANNTADTLIGRLKSLFTFVQACSIISSGAIFAYWPSLTRNLLDTLSIWAVAPAMSSIFTHFDHLDQMLLLTMLAPALVFTIVIAYTIPAHLGLFGSFEKTHAVATTTTMGMFIAWLISPHVLMIAIQSLFCEQIGDSAFITVDFSVRCYTSRWTWHVVIAAIAAFAYGIGVPALFAMVLHTHRHALGNEHAIERYGFLYTPYIEESFWFDLIDVSYKMILAILVAALPPLAQMPTAVVLTALYVVATLLQRPFQHAGDDVLHLSALISVIVVATAGHVGSESPIDIFMVCTVILSLGFQALHRQNQAMKELRFGVKLSKTKSVDATMPMEPIPETVFASFALPSTTKASARRRTLNALHVPLDSVLSLREYESPVEDSGTVSDGGHSMDEMNAASMTPSQHHRSFAAQNPERRRMS